MRGSGRIKRRPLASADVAVERELRDRQDSSADIAQPQIHLSIRVFNYTEADDLFCEVVGVRVGICLSYAQQDQQTAANLARDLLAHADLGLAYALDDGTHGAVSSFWIYFVVSGSIDSCAARATHRPSRYT